MDKWIKKYLKLGKTLADDNDACYSRKIGVVLVSDDNRIISLGYNGSVEKAPHNDSPVYLTYLYKDLLDTEDKERLRKEQGIDSAAALVEAYAGRKVCPRKMLGIPSGCRLELCNCAHAERNCLASANRLGVSTLKSTMYCWCGVPCHDCAMQIIQAGVKKVVCLATAKDYSKSSRGLFSMSDIKLVEVDVEDVLKDK